MKTTLILSAVLSAAALVASHPGPHEQHKRSPSELAKRTFQSKRCAAQVSEMNQKRAAKRSLAKRWDGNGNATSSVQITTEAPFYSGIQNDTCVLTPEVTTGPYIWGQSQTLRQDMAEDQAGVPLFMDIGVIDVNTCEPLEGALIDLWHCNATGSYSSFTGLDPNTPFATLLQEKNLTITDDLDLHTDATTFLRGMWPTDADGMMEMQSIFPGFYVERSIHIHAQVHTDWTLAANGTIKTGNTAMTGQIFFDEDISTYLMALEPYVSHTEINRTTIYEDSIYGQEVEGGWKPTMDVVAVDGVDFRNGVVGYITLGVDSSETDSGSGGF